MARQIHIANLRLFNCRGPDAVIAWDNATRTFSIEPYDPSYEGYVPRFAFYAWSRTADYQRKYEKEELELPDEEGLYVIYYASNDETRTQVLNYLKNPTSAQLEDIYLRKVIVSFIYWNATSNQAEYIGDERHGSEWNPQIHWWAHNVFSGLRDFGLRITGIQKGDGSVDAHAQAGITAGAAFHEDMYHTAEAVASTAGLPILYRTANGPRVGSNAGFLVVTAGSGRLAWNYGTSITECENNRFVFYHIFWTNCQLNPIIAVMGQAQYDTTTEAVAGYDAEMEGIYGWMPHQSRMLITSLLYETSTDFTNAVKGRIAGEMTPEGIAEIIADDKTPSAKTGWTPVIQEQMEFSYDEAEHALTVALLDSFSTFFVSGIKYKQEIPMLFSNLPETLGKTYIDGDGNSWTTSANMWDESATDRVKAVEIYRNPRLSQTQFLGWRMHIWELDGRTRGNIIKKTGLEILSGFDLSINATNAWEIDVADGTLRLADITANILHNSAALPSGSSSAACARAGTT